MPELLFSRGKFAEKFPLIYRPTSSQDSSKCLLTGRHTDKKSLKVATESGTFGERVEDPLIVEVPRAWYQMVDADTAAAFPGISADWVPLTDESNVGNLLDAVFKRISPGYPKVIRGNLQVYDTVDACKRKQPLTFSTELGDRGIDMAHPLIVAMPNFVKKRKTETNLAVEKKPTLMACEPPGVDEHEYQLDALAEKQESQNPIVKTPKLHKFWDGYGYFPPSYFVRKEEVMVWRVIKGYLGNVDKQRVVLLGSPGVGKSCFLMLVGFYLVYAMKEKVLIIRRVKEGDTNSAVVYFDDQGSWSRTTNVNPDKLVTVRKEVRGAKVLVDGYRQDELSLNDGLLPFHFLATSCQFDQKSDDPGHLIVLPAWHVRDLLQYAKLTNWVVDTGLCINKNQLTDSTWPKLVKEQYFYSGGSLGEFRRTRNEVKRRVADNCAVVPAGHKVVLVCGRSPNQVDRIRRHYITDPNNENHYEYATYWKLSVDSGYALEKLGKHVSMEKLLEVYKYGKSIDAGFLGTAYELLLHRAVQEAMKKTRPLVLSIRKGPEYKRMEICGPHFECSGDDEESCYTHLANLRKNTYWHPDYPFFPFIDAVTMCKAFRTDDSTEAEMILIYIKVTIAKEKKFKLDRLEKLNKELHKNADLKELKRAFVVVGPSSVGCEGFELRNAPNNFLTMVGCFDPEEFDPKQ